MSQQDAQPVAVRKPRARGRVQELLLQITQRPTFHPVSALMNRSLHFIATEKHPKEQVKIKKKERKNKKRKNVAVLLCQVGDCRAKKTPHGQQASPNRQELCKDQSHSVVHVAFISCSGANYLAPVFSFTEGLAYFVVLISSLSFCSCNANLQSRVN